VTINQTRQQQRFDALVNHPGWGSLWLSDVHLSNRTVVGTATFPHPLGSGYYERLTMNFPLSCVRKWERT
jgi:hypothetical protein